MIWLTTKITTPQVANGTIVRQRLLQLLVKPIRLTIISAPAGYGKTTVIGQWLTKVNEPKVWLSLDVTDNDPTRFWQYIAKAILVIAPQPFKAQLKLLLEEAVAPSVVADTLINMMAKCQQPLHIVLDDYHVVTHPKITQTMARFIDYLPANVRVYLTSREQVPLPIAKWRVKGWLTEVTASELCFTYGELQQFYKGRQPKPNLQQLLHITEGWVAGVQLASLTEWDGDQRFMLDYLLEEVIQQLSLELQDFLMKTSIITPLTPAMCEALTGDSTSYEKLQEVERKGIFTTRLTGVTPAFTYHYLFAEALQLALHNRFTTTEIRTLYKQASELLYMQGNCTGAIELALKSEHFEQAEKWMLTHLVELFNAGHTATFKRWVAHLRTNHYAVNGEILLMYCITLAITYEVEEAQLVLQELDENLAWQQSPSYEELSQIVEMVRAFIFLASGKDLRQSMVFVNKALTKSSATSRWRTISLAYNLSEASLLHTSLGARGRLLWPEETEPLYQLFSDDEMKDNNLTGFAYGVAAETFYHREQFTEALATAEAAILYGHHFSDPGLFIPMYCMKAKIFVAKRQFTEALSLLTYAMSTTQEPHWQDILRTMRAWCYLQQNDKSLAVASLQAATGVPDKGAKSSYSFWLLTYAELLLSQQQIEQALTICLQVREQAIVTHQITIFIEATLLEALCYQADKQHQAAKNAVGAALKAAKPYGYKTLFLQDAKRKLLVKEYGMTSSNIEVKVYSKELIADSYDAVLTPRELSLMLLLEEGASNSEIATQLGLAEGTVRVYLSTIYSKLGVNSRAKAIALALKHHKK